VAQAATLGQTYGMLSGNPHDLLMTESFHGTIIAWARQAGMFRKGSPDHLQVVNARNLTDPGTLESAWRSWAQAEETARVVLALHVHDSEFAVIFHHEPLLRHDPERLPRCCSEPLFAAATAAQWHTMLVSTTSQEAPVGKSVDDPPCQAPLMQAYGLLAGQIASICEMRGATLDDSRTASDIRRRLTSWYETHFPSIRVSSRDTLCLAILWHEAFMALYISFDLLERVIGREGSQVSEEDVRRVRAWVNTVEGRRCLMHAVLVFKRLQGLPISATPAIHVPKALFYAGLVIYCHVKLRSGDAAAHGDFDIAEVRASELRYTTDLPAAAVHQLDSSSLYGIADLLRRQGHWELSRRFGFILEALIDDLTDYGADGH